MVTPEVVFEDEQVEIVFGETPISLGHLKIYPKQQFKTLEEMPTKLVGHLFSTAARCASLLFDGLQAQGTNIIVNNGKDAGQLGEKVCIDVIARFEKDGLKFTWEPARGDVSKVESAAKEIASKTIVYEPPVKPKSASNEPTKITIPDPSQSELHTSKDIVHQTQTEIVKNAPVEKLESKKSEVAPEKNNSIKSSSDKPKKSEIVDDDEFDPQKNFLYYELMRLP